MKNGYILIMALLMISATTVLVTMLFNRGMMFMPFTRVMIDQEKAHILARSGIEMVKAQLCQSYDPKKKKKTDSDKKGATSDVKTEADKAFLEQLLPILNTWQTFPLKKDIDGVEGEIALYIACQDGMINLNELYDFEKQQFVKEKEKQGSGKTFLQEICKRLEKEIKAPDLFAALEKFLKKQNAPLEDITQLLEIKEFGAFKNRLFYEKIDAAKDSKEAKQSQKDIKQTMPLYLVDLFTVSTNHAKIEPWVFSKGLMSLLGLAVSPEGKDPQKGLLKDALKQFKKTTAWKTEWNTILKPVYQKELQSLFEGIDSFLNDTFSATTFLVMCQTKVGQAKASVCAIVQRSVRAKEEKQEYAILVKKLYWL